MTIRHRIGAAIAAAVLGLGPAAWATEGGGGGGGAALLKPEIGTMFWTALTFLLLLALMARFAWRPLLGAVDERTRSIQSDIDQAQEGREAAEALIAEHRSLVVEARRERAEALALGQRDAEKVKAEILDQARKERDQMMKKTEQQIQGAIDQARDELRAITADLAINAAEKLLSRNLDDSAQRRLVEEHLTDLERSGEGPRLSS